MRCRGWAKVMDEDFEELSSEVCRTMENSRCRKSRGGGSVRERVLHKSLTYEEGNRWPQWQRIILYEKGKTLKRVVVLFDKREGEREIQSEKIFWKGARA